MTSASMDPPTSNSSSLSSLPALARSPMSRFLVSLRPPVTSNMPPISTLSPSPFPRISHIPPTSIVSKCRSPLLSNFPPTSMSLPSPPPRSLAEPPTSILPNLISFDDWNKPPTSIVSRTSPPPIDALPPTSRPVLFTMPSTSSFQPTHEFHQSAHRHALHAPPVLAAEVSFNDTKFHDRAS